MRLGLLGHGFLNWAGGVDFLRGVAASLQAADPHLELHFLAPTNGPLLRADRAARGTYRQLKRLVGKSSHVTRPLDVAHLEQVAGSLDRPAPVHQIDIGERALATAARRLGLGAVLPALRPLSPRFPVPWIGYIYDFQHRHLPHLFTDRECEQRNLAFATLAHEASAIIVNARAVAADVAIYHPDGRARVFALPFNAAPQRSWLVARPDPAPRYGIGGRRYFIVSNQFWRHKDHACAFEALHRCVSAGADFDLVCTGATHDFRFPGYLDELRVGLEAQGLTDRVHILGMLPKLEQIDLMRGAIALVQPTLSEGGPGGGSVFDAVSLGLRCFVSDIPVNREIDGEPDVSYFPARDAASLAALMLRAPISSAALPNEALFARGRERLLACGQQILRAVDHARSASAG